MKSLQLLVGLVALLLTTQLTAQNGWTTCNTTAGILNGTTSDVFATDTTPVAVFTVTPGPTSTIPTTEFVIILRDSMASDTLGDAIIGTSIDGRVAPSALGLSVGDTFTIAPFSYDIQQIKLALHGILTGTVPFVGSCCNLLDLQAPVPGICDSLNAAGIMDSSDVNNINDLLVFLSAFSGGGSTSLRGLNAVLFAINAQMGTLSNVGCTSGVSEICYAADSLASSHDHFAVTTMVNTTKLASTNSLQVVVSPNPFMHHISTGILSKVGGEHIIQVLDATGRTVYHEIKTLAIGEQTIGLHLGNLPAGLYYLQVTDNTNIVTQKIIKR
ncbi:T9SS type A sorting domain-containing protein [Aureispira anguillae]|uniref:T9SS type A sorting domain-containing protein n=1 Tax=Aureispira anguillae TaxID=2864201 RepID=A0A915YIF4_9BACT|nr:T9SS type A sorting domain-containing protein [Aureispira anguillae]BDS13594.1 T9SS type A sorting domain-containing protein [Aureispira anguillae]